VGSATLREWNALVQAEKLVRSGVDIQVTQVLGIGFLQDYYSHVGKGMLELFRHCLYGAPDHQLE
jgi:hypothetical protein